MHLEFVFLLTFCHQQQKKQSIKWKSLNLLLKVYFFSVLACFDDQDHPRNISSSFLIVISVFLSLFPKVITEYPHMLALYFVVKQIYLTLVRVEQRIFSSFSLMLRDATTKAISLLCNVTRRCWWRVYHHAVQPQPVASSSRYVLHRNSIYFLLCFWSATKNHIFQLSRHLVSFPWRWSKLHTHLWKKV